MHPTARPQHAHVNDKRSRRHAALLADPATSPRTLARIARQATRHPNGGQWACLAARHPATPRRTLARLTTAWIARALDPDDPWVAAAGPAIAALATRHGDDAIARYAAVQRRFARRHPGPVVSRPHRDPRHARWIGALQRAATSPDDSPNAPPELLHAIADAVLGEPPAPFRIQETHGDLSGLAAHPHASPDTLRLIAAGCWRALAELDRLGHPLSSAAPCSLAYPAGRPPERRTGRFGTLDPLRVLTTVLARPDCPGDLLARACADRHRAVRAAAAANPLTPEPDAVTAALLGA